MAVRTVEELVLKMQKIVDVWQQGTRHGNQGEAGHTLEDLLGVKENNLRLPDFGDVEIKTQKAEGKDNLLTLFHKEPTSACGQAAVPQLLKAMGWRHKKAGTGKGYPPDEKSFRSTTSGNAYTPRGFTIQCTKDRLSFVFDPTKVAAKNADESKVYLTYGDWLKDINSRKTVNGINPDYQRIFPVYYNLGCLQESFEIKLNHTLLVYYKKKKDKAGRNLYWYDEAYLMKTVRMDQIPKLITDGSLVLDFDARTHHNHGTKLRIKKSKARELFTEFEMMDKGK
ncbi:MAG TPA: MvaI/BcnI family restriction endonuclease [Pyrinomonadaceae bacterium]